MMRNQSLHGYLIHSRKYRERSHIVHLFTQEYGRIDGVLRQTPPPQYQPIRVQASGKSELKNFSQLETMHQPVFFAGDAFFAGFYLNELLLRLCPLEEPMPETFVQYHVAVSQLQQLSAHIQPDIFLRQILRRFEHILLQELGYALDFQYDAQRELIQPERYYQFHLSEGFVPVHAQTHAALSGHLIQSMQDALSEPEFNAQQLQLLGKLYRQMIMSLLGDRPLKSRQLWIQHLPTQS